LVGFLLPAWHRSIRKRQKTQPKFYFFDCGVKRALANELNIAIQPQTSEYGRLFEHWLITELFRYNHYKQLDFTFSYLATYDVDIIPNYGMNYCGNSTINVEPSCRLLCT